MASGSDRFHNCGDGVHSDHLAAHQVRLNVWGVIAYTLGGLPGPAYSGFHLNKEEA